MVKSQVSLHGLKEEDAIIGMQPREGETYIRTEDILKLIEEQGDSIALVMFGGVQFYTGQCFEMEKITKAGHAKVRCVFLFCICLPASVLSVYSLWEWECHTFSCRHFRSGLYGRIRPGACCGQCAAPAARLGRRLRLLLHLQV